MSSEAGGPKHPLSIDDETPSQNRPPKGPRIEEIEGEREGSGEEKTETTNMSSLVKQQIQQQKHGVQRYLIAIEYIGTRFVGSQIQPKQRTVVGVLQEAFRKFVGQPVSIFCSSRTDAGVHAMANVCHVDVERISKRKPGEVLPPHEPSIVRKAVNHFLLKEGDVMIVDVRSVASDFHARYKALERTYYYRLLSGPEALSTFERDRGWHVPEDLNLQAMQEACKVLSGQHDFSSFRASGCQAKSPIKNLDELEVSESVATPYFPSSTGASVSSSGDVGIEMSNGSSLGFGIRRHRCLVVKARARSFLYHQVRLLVGVLKCVGTGHLTIADVERILEAKTVTAASPMAPSCGLYLGQVKYDLD